MTFIYRGRWSDNAGPDHRYCAASVHDDFGVGFHQCSRKPTVTREVKGAAYGFCRQHDPVSVTARRDAWNARWDAERRARDAERERARQEESAFKASKAALEAIAAGHNDARALAVETLALFPVKETGGAR